MTVSGPYQPKVGDKVVANKKTSGEGVMNVMEFLCEWYPGVCAVCSGYWLAEAVADITCRI
jgi:hypothetical protein